MKQFINLTNYVNEISKLSIDQILFQKSIFKTLTNLHFGNKGVVNLRQFALIFCWYINFVT